MESKLQAKLIKYLKSKGCYVIKLQSGPGVPNGAPDVVAFLEGLWMGFEVKSSAKAKFQPNQKETVKKLNEWSYCRIVYPSNYDGIKFELDNLLAE